MPNLTLLGPFPPPFGGVAVHLVRLLEGLRYKGVAVRGASTGGLPQGVTGVRRMGLGELVKRGPIHLHTDEGNARRTVLLGGAWKGLGRPFALTVHSFRDRPDLAHLDQQLTRVYQEARLIIAISNDVRDAVADRLLLDRDKIHVVTSALPISRWELEQSVPDVVPPDWIGAKTRILANAGRVVRYQGADLYGIDTVIDAFTELEVEDASLLLVLGEVVDQDLHQELLRKTVSDRRIHVISRLQSPLAPITRAATIVVRPTRTEGGESLTLTEAIECGVWAVGSDAVKRPEGTVLFRTGDSAHLCEVLSEVAGRQHAPAAVSLRGGALDELLNAYREAGLVPNA